MEVLKIAHGEGKRKEIEEDNFPKLNYPLKWGGGGEGGKEKGESRVGGRGGRRVILGRKRKRNLSEEMHSY